MRDLDVSASVKVLRYRQGVFGLVKSPCPPEVTVRVGDLTGQTLALAQELKKLLPFACYIISHLIAKQFLKWLCATYPRRAFFQTTDITQLVILHLLQGNASQAQPSLRSSSLKPHHHVSSCCWDIWQLTVFYYTFFYIPVKSSPVSVCRC